MIINKAYKYRIYPNSQQVLQIEQNFGNARFVYNYFLNLKKEKYETNKESISLYKTQSLMTKLKKTQEFSWLNLSDSMSLQESLKDLDKAYKGFFNSSGYPRFHKKGDKESYRIRNQNNVIRILDDKHINLPLLKSTKIKLSRTPNGRILNATISKTKTGKYFVSLCSEEELTIKENNGKYVGIDLGIKDLLIESNGNKVLNNKYLLKYQKQLKRHQKKLSKMIESHIIEYKTIGNKRYPVYDKELKDCSNIQKQRIKISKIHEKIANSRNDTLQKISTRLVKENQFIALEDLNVKGMIKNHYLANSINDVSWSKLVTMLKYKAMEHGTTITQVDRFFPSSKLCNVCGYKKIDLKLSERDWTCPICNTYHNRDINAAINILNEGLRLAGAQNK